MASIKSLSRQNHLFISPDNCGSSVGYYINVDEFFNKRENKIDYTVSASVVLADCTHKIDWLFAADEDEKITNTINVLTEFRKQLLETSRRIKKLTKAQETK